ncbi:hypothetical protein L6255_00315 [Candidatus Parcubacteria bacterium]|nr:hypothetical protein [Patescibacteria group bacterium]MCG2688884.1 hypothetical protein [Candidatus Parcubacteria bacterium]
MRFTYMVDNGRHQFLCIYQGRKNKDDLRKVKHLFNELKPKLKLFFNTQLPRVNVRLFYERENFNKYLGKETKNWEVGFLDYKRRVIGLFAPSVFSYISGRRREDFLKIFCHELSHLCFLELTNGSSLPIWLNEGLAYVASNQLQPLKTRHFPKGGIFVGIGDYQGWTNFIKHDGYNFAGHFVEFLIKKVGLEAILKVLRIQFMTYDVQLFKNAFEENTGLKVPSLEQEFKNLMNLQSNN